MENKRMNTITGVDEKTPEEILRTYIDNENLTKGRQLSAYVHSYGCQQNVADGETLLGILLELGFTIGNTPETSDLVLYNTCAIRENAEDRVFGNVGALKEAKTKRPEMIIGLCGCMVQQKHVAEKIKKSYPFVDLLFGAGAMHTLPELLATHITSGKRVFELLDPTGEIVEDLPVYRENGFQGYIPIMTGCDNFCTYCIVPHVRGRERSREPDLIINDAKKLIEDGYKEITLLGQNVNSYGKGLENEISFGDLLEQIATLPGKFRVRFMTSHPKDCTPALLDIMAKHDNIGKHLHLPVQSGSDIILKDMNRKYTIEHYLELVQYAKKYMPMLTLTSDLIVGFPGETEEDFQKTLNLVKTVQYSSLFTFAYSPRKGTAAAKMKQTLTQQEKSDRFQRLLSLQREQANAYHQTLLGEKMEILVDGVDKERDNGLTGRTDGNVIVLLKGDSSLVGNFVTVEIIDYHNWALIGQKL